MNEPIFLDLSTKDKYRLCPFPPPHDPIWRKLSLVFPPIATAFGFFLFGIFAIGFTELRSMPDGIRFYVVLLGAIAIPAGGELGTVSSVVEIFRKHYRNRGTTKLDWVGLVVSMVSSMVGLVLSWAYLLKTDITWSEWVKVWGPLVYGTFTVADFVFSLLEMGAYLGEKEREFDKWREKKFDPWIKEREEQANKPVQPIQMAYTDPVGQAQYYNPPQSTLRPDEDALIMPRTPRENDNGHDDERFRPELLQDNGQFHPVVARALAQVEKVEKEGS